ncbi:uncharacterized protein FIBRA_09264 [Fibroporia radiculosa]|uniref:Uncharacterized protein n=1 Tax=Fibroporia radiculosa TaxID=599839 RepID=J7RVM7_9APHY|nr:uncharacterized protein FIBRA_09264 [Fibroporia radiculosa]CCM06950.1 predicted protein [Fibroporia radiculosa]
MTVPTKPRGKPQFMGKQEGEVTVVIEYDDTGDPHITSYAAIPSIQNKQTIPALYLSACDNVFSYLQSLYTKDASNTSSASTDAATWALSFLAAADFPIPESRPVVPHSISVSSQAPSATSKSSFSPSVLPYNISSISSPDLVNALIKSQNSYDTVSFDLDLPELTPVDDDSDDEDKEPIYESFAGTKKKYKPVALKTRPVLGAIEEQFHIRRDIKGNPLETMLTLSKHPPPFKQISDKLHGGDFLLSAERELIHHFMLLHNNAFAWTDDERGCFKPAYFPPVEIPVVPHTPWVQQNIPILPGLYNEVCTQDDKALHIVHSLEPLNTVTIQHSEVPPTPEHLAEQFGGRPCGGMLDLFVGYDKCLIAEKSRDLTTFQSPYGALRLQTLPMGWTNSVLIFHEDVTYILQPKIPKITIPYINDVLIKGLETDYGGERLLENNGIHQFVWEHFENLNRVVTRMRYAGGTFSGPKSVLIAQEIMVVGHQCTPEGWLPNES